MENRLSPIIVETKVNKQVRDSWKIWTTAADIMQWNIPFDDWHCPRVENDVRPGGKFSFRMEAKDGSAGFDHAGKYDKVISYQLIEYTVSDGRRSVIEFVPEGDSTRVIETFDPEKENPIGMQQDFCQSVLNRFKKYAENRPQ